MNFDTSYPSCFLDRLVQRAGEAKHIAWRRLFVNANWIRSVNFLDIRNFSDLCHYTMAALALRETQSLLPALRFSIARWLPPILGSAVVGWPTISRTIPSLQSFLELFPPIVLAVPKKKTSHSRKSMRSANKGLKDKQSMFFLALPFPS